MTRFLLAGLMACALCGDAHAQTLGGAPPLEFPLWRLAFGLVLCCGLAIGAAVVMKRFHTPGAPPRLRNALLMFRDARQIQVLEFQRIGLHADACRISCWGQEHFIVVAQGGVAILNQRDVVLRPEASEGSRKSASPLERSGP